VKVTSAAAPARVEPLFEQHEQTQQPKLRGLRGEARHDENSRSVLLIN
jgi:hypothetical protein